MAAAMLELRAAALRAARAAVAMGKRGPFVGSSTRCMCRPATERRTRCTGCNPGGSRNSCLSTAKPHDSHTTSLSTFEPRAGRGRSRLGRTRIQRSLDATRIHNPRYTTRVKYHRSLHWYGIAAIGMRSVLGWHSSAGGAVPAPRAPARQALSNRPSRPAS